MPVALGFLLFTLGAPLGVVNFVTIGIGASILNALGSAALGIGISLVSALINKPSVPKAEDGKYNLKQNVPSRVRIYGRVKKGGDYILLEEANGVAYHAIAHASHKIRAYVEHYLHDERVLLDGDDLVNNPSHFQDKVRIHWRLGEASETCYNNFVADLPTIWTEDHRGDGIASIGMTVASPPQEDIQSVFPSGMPVHTAVIDGTDVYDPRISTSTYSENLALIRADHIRHPSGGAKLAFDDLYWPDWSHAADVCDQLITDRYGTTRSRYQGGIWYRYSNDQIEVGRLIDQAAQMVIYERADGKIGVHAGEYVEPDIRLTAKDILSCRFDPNRRRASSVLAVRGRYTNPGKGWNQDDAAIYGNPYVEGDTERSRTVENQVVQWHNHMQRLQKVAFIRANATLVHIVATYEAARNVPYRRYIKVHLPSKLTETVVEIIGRPKLSLARLTYEFDAIVVPSTLYAFDSATEEGVPGAEIVPAPPGGVPVPEGFAVEILSRDIGSGVRAAYAVGSWTHVSDGLVYELTWQPTAGGAIGSIVSRSGEDSVETGYLTDGIEYRFRERAWASGGKSSSWTSYITQTITADPTAPPVPAGVSATGGTGSAALAWTTPNSTHFVSTRIYRHTVNDFSTATQIDVVYSGPSLARSYTDTVAAGAYYYWLTSANGSGIQSADVPTGSVTVS